MNLRKGLLLAVAVITLGATLLAAIFVLSPSEPADANAMNAANALVESGRTVEAIEIYQQLIKRGADDSAIYYNLGNAYFQEGEMVQAVAGYSRAAALAPRDADIQANLTLALAQAPDLTPLEPTGPMGLLAGLTDGWLSINETALLVLGLWFIALFLLLTRRVLNNGSRWTGRLAAVLTLFVVILGLSLASRAIAAQTLPGGLVLDEVVALVERQ